MWNRDYRQIERIAAKIYSPIGSVDKKDTHKQTKSRVPQKVAATVSSCEGVYNRSGETSVTFCIQGGARFRGRCLIHIK